MAGVKGMHQLSAEPGRQLLKGDYILIKVEPEHKSPRVHRGWEYQQDYVMEKHLGRYLMPGEVVIHKNSIGSDDDISNLKLVSEAEAQEIRRLKSLDARKQRMSGERKRRAGKIDSVRVCGHDYYIKWDKTGTNHTSVSKKVWFKKTGFRQSPEGRDTISEAMTGRSRGKTGKQVHPHTGPKLYYNYFLDGAKIDEYEAAKKNKRSVSTIIFWSRNNLHGYSRKVLGPACGGKKGKR